MAAATLLVAVSANAQDPLVQRQATYRKAHEAMLAGNFADAETLLLELWNYSHTYDTAASLGEVEFELKKYAQAAKYVAFALNNLAPKEKPSVAENLRTQFTQVAALVGTVRTNVAPAGAEVFVDGTSEGTAPLATDIFVDPGEHTFEARYSDRRAVKQLRIGRGEATRIDLRVPDPPEAQAPPRGASAPAPMPSASNAIEPAPADARRSKSLVPIFVGGGVAVAGFVTAGVFAAEASSRRDELKSLNAGLAPTACARGAASASTCRAVQNKVDEQHRDATLADVGLGVGIVATLATIAYAVFWPASKDTSTVHVDIRFNPRGSAVTFGSSF